MATPNDIATPNSVAGPNSGAAPNAAADTSAFRTRVVVKAVAGVDEGTRAEALRGADDLTAIRRIDRGLAARLHGLGVTSFEAIAGWDRYEVRRVAAALELGKRIWRENWIEQAALLAMQMRERTRVAGDLATVGTVAVDWVAAPATNGHLGDAHAVEGEGMQEDSGAAESAVVLKVAPVSEARPADAAAPAPEGPVLAMFAKGALAVEQAPGRDARPVERTVVAERTGPVERSFKAGQSGRRLPAPAQRRFVYIRGVSERMADALRAAGVQTIADIAAWTRADVRWFQAILGADARISADQWIEQAAVLAKGSWTRFALKVVNGETRLVVEKPAEVVVQAPALVRMPVGTADGDRDRDRAQRVLDGGRRAIAREPAGLIDQTEALSVPPTTLEAEAEAPTRAAPVAAVIEPRPEVAPAWPHALGRIHPMRGLSTVVALGQIRRPPPDLGVRGRTEPVPAEVTTTGLVENDVNPTSGETATIAVEPPTFGGAMGAARDDARADAAPEQTLDTDAVWNAAPGDDWADAEALVIVKSDGERVPRTVPPPVAEPVANSTEAGRTDGLKEGIGAFGKAGSTATDAGEVDETPEDFKDDWRDQWAGEADVVIVSRPRPTDAQANETKQPASTVRAPTEAQHRRPSQPPFLRRAARHYDDDNEVIEAGYAGAGPEATVTIIRAEKSETTASAIFPAKIANDAEAPESGRSDRSSRKAGLKSRFLKALTGE